MVNEQLILTIIGTYGFPIAVTIWLLVERNKTLKELTKVINDLHITIKAIHGK